MRLIYADEAGTSPNEAVRVVAAVIVHGDHEWRAVAEHIKTLVREFVPIQFREGFIFHAKDVHNGGPYRNSWPLDDRMEFIQAFAEIPMELNIPITVGVQWAGQSAYDEVFSNQIKKIVKKHEYEHLVAFTDCMERADYFLRSRLFPEENGIVTVEDNAGMRKLLRNCGLIWRDKPLYIPHFGMGQNYQQFLAGQSPDPHTYKIERIIDEPNFVGKSGSVMLQLADIAAFIIRRALERRKDGEILLRSLLGDAADAMLFHEAWYRSKSSAIFNTQNYPYLGSGS